MTVSDSHNVASRVALSFISFKIREYRYLCVTSPKVSQEETTSCRKKWNKSQCGRKVAVKETATENRRTADSVEMIVAVARLNNI